VIDTQCISLPELSPHSLSLKRVPFLSPVILDRYGIGFLGSHYQHQLLSSRHCRVYKVPLEHHVVLGEQRDDDAVLRSLRLVNGHGVCQPYLIDSKVFISRASTIEFDPDLLAIRVDACHAAT